MSEHEGEHNWTHFIVGLMLLVFAVFMYWVFTRYQASGGSIRMPAIFAIPYGLLGKWGVVAPLGLLGLGAIWVGWSPPRGDE